MPSICVVGSVNLDLVMIVDRVPEVGETVLGGDLERIPGGKGGNQAVAAVRSGGDVYMVGRVGEDEAGRVLRRSLEDAGVNTDRVLETPGCNSGTALIAVQADGDNAIVVSPGANARLSAQDVRESAMVANADVVLAQAEVPREAVLTAASTCGGLFVWNVAPVPSWTADLLPFVDVLVVNEPELRAVMGSTTMPPTGEIAKWSAASGIAAVVVTLGSEGALLVSEGEVAQIPAPAVNVVDTTGAGDAFCGALAVRLAAHRAIPTVADVQFAVAAGTAATQVRGAR
ncbi:MAG: ribokinase [Acidimicrobiales bacterium]|nr:ribokinase [Acidimicrobiales bacterium]